MISLIYLMIFIRGYRIFFEGVLNYIWINIIILEEFEWIGYLYNFYYWFLVKDLVIFFL